MTTSVSEILAIGGGHNGLVCACFPARAGLSVTVVESGPHPGGFIQRWSFPPSGAASSWVPTKHGGLLGSVVAADLERS
jgi:phytoene dehydrogenase-like protein